MGNIYFRQLDFYKSEGFYQAAFEMREKYLPVGNSHRLRCIKTLSQLHQKKDDNNIRSLQFCSQQLQLHEEYFQDKSFKYCTFIDDYW